MTTALQTAIADPEPGSVAARLVKELSARMLDL